MRRTVLLVMTLTLGLAAPSARADRRVDGLVAKLRADPVVLSTALTRSVPPREVAALRRVAAAASVPLFVVVAPSFTGEAGLQTLDALPDLLHDGLDRDGIYLAVDGGSVYAQAFGVRPRFSLRDLSFAVHDDRPDAEPGEAARYAVTLLTTGRRAPVAKRPQAPEEGSVQGLAVVPARVFEHARTAQAGDLREEIEQRLVAFAELIDREDVPSRELAQERQQHALDAYAAARRVLQSQPRMVDLVGALVLVEQGSRALAAAQALEAGRDEEPVAPLCFFDPRHPGQTRPRAWERGLTVPACAPCTSHLRANRSPETLLDAGKPWFEADSLWARTGFGVFEPDLAQRVIRGELRR